MSNSTERYNKKRKEQQDAAAAISLLADENGTHEPATVTARRLYGDTHYNLKPVKKTFKYLGIALALIIGTVLGLVAAVALTTLFSFGGIIWLTLLFDALLIISGFIIEGSVYAHNVSNSLKQLAMSAIDIVRTGDINRFFFPMQVRLMMKELLTNKQLSQALDNHMIKFEHLWKTEYHTDSAKYQAKRRKKLLRRLINCYYNEDHQLEALDPKLYQLLALQIESLNDDKKFQRRIKIKKGLILGSIPFAAIAGLAFGAITYTHTTAALLVLMFIPSLPGWLVAGLAAHWTIPILALSVGLIIGFGYSLLTLYTLTESIETNRLKELWRAFKRIVVPKVSDETTSLDEYWQSLAKLWRKMTPMERLNYVVNYICGYWVFIPLLILTSACCIIAASSAGALAHACIDAITSTILLFTHVNTISSTILHSITIGCWTMIILGFSPVDLVFNLSTAFDAVIDLWRSFSELFTGKMNIKQRVINRVTVDYRENSWLILGDIFTATLFVVVYALLLIHLVAEAVIPGEGATKTTGSVWLGRGAAILDFFIEFLSHFEFVKGSSEHTHDHVDDEESHHHCHDHGSGTVKAIQNGLRNSYRWLMGKELPCFRHQHKQPPHEHESLDGEGNSTHSEATLPHSDSVSGVEIVVAGEKLMTNVTAKSTTTVTKTPVATGDTYEPVVGQEYFFKRGVKMSQEYGRQSCAAMLLGSNTSPHNPASAA